ncbi:MAG TPA: enoyl-CoA hydratase/isomerase family protein, partial [Parachlamydiaceae bacterium]|nr:enoyl-CoA hydratase/isomerase family protein [Parachlamydiaceae bacterium]
QDLTGALEALQNDHFLRVIIIKGDGSCFCSGLDLKEAADLATSKNSIEALEKALKTLHKSPFITIAAVHGQAFGGGAGLVSACDFAIAEEGALIGYPEVKRGLIPAQVMVFLKRKVKERDMKELLLLGEPVKAEKAFSMGLINKVVSEKNLMPETIKLAEQIFRTAPKAVIKTKELLDTLTGNFDQDLSNMRQEAEKWRSTDEAKEGFKAFIEKRSPIF